MSKVRQLTFLFLSIGLICAAFAFILMTGGAMVKNSLLELLRFMGDIAFNLTVAVVALYTSAYLLTGKMEKLIFESKWKAIPTGILFSFLILLIGTFSGSLVGFFGEGFDRPHDTFSESFFDYIVKPLYWVGLVGFLPTLVLGGLLGFFVKRKCGPAA